MEHKMTIKNDISNFIDEISKKTKGQVTNKNE